jgi:hypothetical protein
MDIPDHELRTTLKEKDWENGPKFEALLRFDQVSLSYFLRPYQNDSHSLLTQLKKAMQSKRAFEGFQEAPINHMPYVFCNWTFSSIHGPVATLLEHIDLVQEWPWIIWDMI